MFVRTLTELKDTESTQIYWQGTMKNVDLVSNADGLGFSIHDVRASAGLEHELWYKNHWEANYFISGTASVENLDTGEIWQMGPGAIYLVGPTDRHRIIAETDFHVISVFNPALSIGIDYDEDGALPPTGDIPAGRAGMFIKTIDELRADGREMKMAAGKVKTLRALLQEDGLGFTLSDVSISAGTECSLWYKHHQQANYVVNGSGKLVNPSNNQSWALGPGSLYVVGPDDRHILTADTDLHLLSVINPPLRGDEQYDDAGTLPAPGFVPAGADESG